MWLRSELKERGKQNFKKTYGYAIVVSIVLQVVFGFTITTSDIDARGNGNEYYEGYNIPQTLANRVLPKFAVDSAYYFRGSSTMSFVIIVMMLFIAIKIFACYPLEIGAQKFYIHKPEEERKLDCLLFSFRSVYYKSHISAMFQRSVFTTLWSLLFWIPGIVKSYEYRMIPYILADEPSMSAAGAFQKSREMMDGQKWNVFILDLSFILWLILSACTLNIAGIFYVRPYQDATNAELYLELSKAMNDKYVSVDSTNW